MCKSNKIYPRSCPTDNGSISFFSWLLHNHLPLLGLQHSPPPFFSISKTHASKEEKFWENSIFQKETDKKKKEWFYLDHFYLPTHSGSCNTFNPFLWGFSQQTRKLLLWSLTRLLGDSVFWKGHQTLFLKSKCSFYLSDKGKAQSCCVEEENSPFPAYSDGLWSPIAVVQDQRAVV